MRQIDYEKLIESSYWDNTWDDNLDQLPPVALGLLMYKLIERNVQHDAGQRHKMYDVLERLERHQKNIKPTWRLNYDHQDDYRDEVVKSINRLTDEV